MAHTLNIECVGHVACDELQPWMVHHPAQHRRSQPSKVYSNCSARSKATLTTLATRTYHSSAHTY